MKEERLIKIDGKLYHVTDYREYGAIEIVTEEGEEFVLFQSEEDAGEQAKEYWEDLAINDPQEFTCLVGEETLVQWGLGQWGGPGSTKVQSLHEWLDLWLDTPEEHWASYDGLEREVTRIGRLADDIGFVPTIAYRTN